MTSSGDSPETFGALLKRYRVAAGLSQEALAERANLTAQGIGALERGLRQTPHRDTVQMLAGALNLSADERAALESTVRRRHGPPPTPRSGASLTLPPAPGPLIGREREETVVAGFLRRGDKRLLTLVGPGGVGKTHLALHVAAALADDFADGVAFVALALVSDAGLVPMTVARALGLQESGGRSLHDSLIESLREKRLLLVLDNFEHVAAATPLVAELLGICRRLVVLVTSRASLHIQDEQEFVVAPLALPNPTDLSDLTVLAQSPAVELFAQRARTVMADFEMTAANAQAIAGICRRLDGLPLALELAAPWIKLLPPPALLARLERRLPLLAGRTFSRSPRQQTLRGAIAWSYDLLDPNEQRLFRRLCVFAGGCSLEAADAVCIGDADDDAHRELALLEGLASLVNKSLLRQEEQTNPSAGISEPRLLMLETVREFGLEALEASGEAQTLHQRHAGAFLALAEEAAPQLRAPSQRIWRERLDQEHDNLRAALHWAAQSGEVESGLRLAGALWYFWFTRGHLTEGRQWLEDLLMRAESGQGVVQPFVRARALLWTATFATEQGDYERAIALCEESDALCRELDDIWGLAWSLNVRGEMARRRGDHTGAIALFEQSLAQFRSLGDRWCVAVLLNNLGIQARDQGDIERAAALYEESLALTRALGDTWSVAMTLGNLGEVARDQGDKARAVAMCEESLTLFRELSDQRGVAYALNYLGVVARERGDAERALALYSESLALWRQVGDRAGIATCLEGLAEASCGLGQSSLAARLLGAAAILRDRIGAPVPPADQMDYERTLAAVRSTLGHAFLPAWEVGQALPLEQVIGEALNIGAIARPDPIAEAR